MKLLRVASLILVVCASYSSSSDFKNGTDIIDSQWQQFKVSECHANHVIEITQSISNRLILKEIIQPTKIQCDYSYSKRHWSRLKSIIRSLSWVKLMCQRH